MTVSSTVNKIIYPGNGSTTVFPFAFSVPSASDIQVFFTDINGNVTTLVQGSGATQYQITINPVSGTNPTPAGGSVTYNPSGIPIPLNTSLTIVRTLPLTQATSLANQGTLYQPVEEAALDYGMMATQQLQEIQGRALAVAVSDPTPANLPAIAARANLFLAFDSSGNPIASQPGGANTPISSAMVPVVTAATLAASRTAYGLGSLATASAGVGLSLSGVVAYPSLITIADSSNQSIGNSQHLNVRDATGALTYTLAQTSTLVAGFAFWVNALTASVTFAINAADKFSGAATGASMVIPPGSQAFLTTDAAGTWYLVLNNAPANLEVAQNLQLNATVSANALTVALKDRNGNDPSTASPIVIGFRDPTIANGDPVIRVVTGPLSITVPVNASIGTQNNQAGRIWIGVFDNAGSLILGVYNALNPAAPSIFPWDETSSISTTAVTAGSNNSQQWYTSSTLTNKAFRILGYIEVTEASAGTWATAPSKIQLFGPGVKRPGDTVQSVYINDVVGGTTTSATFADLGHPHVTITPSSAANVIRVESMGGLSDSVSSTINTQLSRGTVANTNMIGNVSQQNPSGAGLAGGVSMIAYDQPNTISSTTYAVQGKTTGGTLTYTGASAATEIQI